MPARRGRHAERTHRGVARDVVTLLVAFGVVPLAALALAFLLWAVQTRRSSVAEMQCEIAQGIAATVSTYLDETSQAIAHAASRMGRNADDPRRVREEAQDLLDRGPEYETLAVLDPHGHERLKLSRYYTFRQFELADVELSPGFLGALQDDVVIGDVGVGGFSEAPHVTMSAAIRDVKGDLRGVLRAEVSIAILWSLTSSHRLGSSRYAYVVDRQGNLIAHEEMSSVLEHRNLAEVQAVALARRGEFGVGSYPGLRGERVIGATAEVPEAGWVVVVEIPALEAYRGLYVLTAAFGALLLATVTGAVWLGVRFSFRRVVEPIRQLQRESEAVARGDLDRRIEVRSEDELGQLAASFNAMVSELRATTVSRDSLVREVAERKRAEAALRERTEELTERVKELQCLYSISSVVGRTDLSLDETAEAVANLIPGGWRYPEITCVRVVIDGLEYASENFRETPWRLTGQIQLHGRPPGLVEVGYLEERPPQDEGPFSREERYLIDEIASRLEEVAERKRVERELTAARERAERASRLKSEFLTNVSHELRTPLNSVLGYADLLLDGVDGELNPAQRASLERVRGNARQLLHLINEILDLSKIESNRMALERQVVRPRELVHEIVRMLRVLADRKGLELSCAVAPDVPPVVFGDEVRLRQILLNLGENAIKFTDRGSVCLQVQRQEAPGGRLCLHFAIQDTGVGIDPARLQDIFEPFVQADGTSTRRHGGTGLGLAISAHLVRMMGGRIWVESTVGQGSTFHFTACFDAGRS